MSWQINMAEFIFFLSIFFVLYIYLGYPLIIWLFGLAVPRKIAKKSCEHPFVSILIAAYNEADCIGATITNKLELDYPPEKMEIIVVSDGSTDGTDDCVNSFSDSRVTLFRMDKRAGKTAALNFAVNKAQGEIIVFSDANSLYGRDAVRALTQNFCDPSVGYVTGHMVYVNCDGTLVGDGCSAYMKYENLIRKYETKIGSIVGVDGGIDAIRKKLYVPMQADQLPDFVLPLQVVRQGYRVVYEPTALLKEDALNLAADEYRMRVRVALRALWALYDMRSLLFSQKNILYAFQIWSHKTLRYVTFLFLIGAFLANVMLWSDGTLYQFLFSVQCVFYLLACIPFVLKSKTSPIRVIHFANYFLLVHLSFLQAFVNFLSGKKVVIWTPRKG